MVKVFSKSKFSLVSLILLIIMSISNLQAQVNTSPNSDFSMLNFTNWIGSYNNTGTPSCYTPIMNSGSLPNCTPINPPPIFLFFTNGFNTTPTITNPSLHTIVSMQNTSYPNAQSPNGTGLYDSLTNYGLRKIPQGVNQVARLNSWKASYQNAQLQFSILVDTNYEGVFCFSYASVFENPSHTCSDFPYFQVRILDYMGNPFNNANSSFTCAPGITTSNLNVCSAIGHIIHWYNWQTIGLNIKPYHGQIITIQFIAASCGTGTHFGYTYFYAKTLSGKINCSYCVSGNQAKLIAPEGYNYKWLQGGDTTQLKTINNPVDGSSYSCIIYSKANASIIDTLNFTFVLANYIPNFQYNNTCVNAPVMFSKTNNADTLTSQWSWDFGNPGSVGNIINMGVNVSHIYNNTGTYNVKLIRNAGGCFDTVIKTITIHPKPIITVNNASICPGNTAQLIANGASTYLWNNGLTGNIINVSPLVDQVFTVIGTDTNGCKDSTFSIVYLYDEPQISFTADTIDGCSPITTHFINFTDPPNCAFLWDFGDGSTSTLKDPIHTYTGGVYTVTLKGTTTNGCIAVSYATNLIDAYYQPHADFYWNPVFPVPGSPVTFGNLTTPIDTNYTYTWIFGDGNTSNLMYPNHTFTSIGNYNLNLIVMSDYGCVDTISNTIHITGVGIKENTLKDVKVVMDNTFQMLMISNLSMNSIITIYDITGKQLLSHKSNQYLNVDMSKYAKGIYTVNIKDANGNITKKIIKE